MIRDIYNPIDTVSEQNIEYVQSVLTSDTLLTGVGKFSSERIIPLSTNVMTDFERTDYLMTSQEMWDDPNQRENGDQFFNGVLQEAFTHPTDDRFSREEEQKRDNILGISTHTLDEYISPIIAEAYRRNDVKELLLQKFTNANAAGIERHLDINYPSIIFMCIYSSIQAGYFGGMDYYPLCKDLMDSLKTGGIPAGWIGPPPENGGKGKDCLQIIHFGPKV